MKKRLYIQGMTCVACETLLKKSCNKIAGCEVDKVSHKKGYIDCDCKNKSTVNKVKKTIESQGYQVSEEKTQTNPRRQVFYKTTDEWIQIGAIAFATVAMILALGQIDMSTRMPSIGSDISIGIALLVGVVASLSSCLAVVGGLVIGFSEYIDESTTRRGHLRVQGSFQLGRIAGFALGGAILGLLGNVIAINLGVQGLLNIIIGIVFLYLGLYMVGLLPNISQLGFHLPSSWTEKLHTQNNPRYAPVIGALTFFLPCGFTQSMQILALGSGDPLQGALVMAAFALGTTPVLLGVGLGSSYVKEHSMNTFNRAIGCMIFFFGIYTISNGRSLVGGLGIFQPTLAKQAADTAVAVEYEKLEVGHDGWQLVPETVGLEAGKSYEIIITPEEDGIGCMSSLTVPKLDKSVHRILKGQQIVYRFENMQAGTYPVVCASMGMSQGKFVVN